MMTIDEMITVLTHYKNGGKVQHTDKNLKLIWRDMLDGQEPSWDFSCVSYRAKHEPLVLWIVTDSCDRVFYADKSEPFSGYFPQKCRKFVEVME